MVMMAIVMPIVTYCNETFDHDIDGDGDSYGNSHSICDKHCECLADGYGADDDYATTFALVTIPPSCSSSQDLMTLPFACGTLARSVRSPCSKGTIER
jgi:hypothetical protein